MTLTEWKAKRIADHKCQLEILARSVGCLTSGTELLILLRRIEVRTYAGCLAFCSVESYGQARWDADKDQARRDLKKVFGGKIPLGVYVNGDPRGHALKLDNEIVPVPHDMHRDMGSDGILAPADSDFE